MADHHQPYRYQQKDKYYTPKLLAVLTLFPIGSLCFLLSGLILTGTLIILTIATPLFFILSPILVPAILTVVLTVTGFLTAGGFGITALYLMAFIVNYFRKMSGGTRGRGSVHDQLDYAKVEDMGQRIQELDWA